MDAPQLLFSTGKIGSLTLKNRLIMAPMVRNYADEHGRMTPRYLAHLERIARGGVGAMILEASFVSPEGRGFAMSWGCMMTAVIAGLRQAVELVHAHEHGAHRHPALPCRVARPPRRSAASSRSRLPRSLVRCCRNCHGHWIAEIHALVRAFGNAARARQGRRHGLRGDPCRPWLSHHPVPLAVQQSPSRRLRWQHGEPPALPRRDHQTQCARRSARISPSPCGSRPTRWCRGASSRRTLRTWPPGWRNVASPRYMSPQATTLPIPAAT